MTTFQAKGLVGGYGGVQVVHGVDLMVESGEMVALLGANGAGKSTTLLTLGGALPALGGEVLLDGAQVRGLLETRARAGIGLLLEERSIFPGLSVRDNLRLGSGGVDGALEVFDELAPLMARKAGLLSGGEQQMLVTARMLATKPKVLLADELSLGLAPIAVQKLLGALRRAADAGVAVLVVEQHAAQCLQFADRAYVMRRGRVHLEKAAADIIADPQLLHEGYLSGTDLAHEAGPST